MAQNPTCAEGPAASAVVAASASEMMQYPTCAEGPAAAVTASASEKRHDVTACTWKPASARLTANQEFGCRYSGPGGCTGGWQKGKYFVSGRGGKWWPAGMYREAVPSMQRPGEWDAFCWTHRKEAAGLRAAYATAADGPAPAPVASGSLDERIAATCALFPGLQMPTSTDDDLSRPVEKRKQRHENMTDVEVSRYATNSEERAVPRGRWRAGTRCVYRRTKEETNTCGKKSTHRRGIAYRASPLR